jgi:hypothetical protein
MLSTTQPSFFSVSLQQGKKLGVSIYKERIKVKKGDTLQIGDWKNDESPPEWIIQYYVPTTWAEDGSWGYHTPIYMSLGHAHIILPNPPDVGDFQDHYGSHYRK